MNHKKLKSMAAESGERRMTRVVHCKQEKYDVYIGRPSKWGNPYSHRRGTLAQWGAPTRQAAIDAYRYWITQPQQASLLSAVKIELRGKILGCWCKPKPCHGDILAEIADNDT